MTLGEYLKLPYTRLVNEINDESGHYWYGKILELDGCQSNGETAEQLMLNLDEAMEGWIETKLAHNLPVPKPTEYSERHSGKYLLRMPRSLHQRLAIEAKREGVSFNQYALYKLSV
ncbi:pilus biosynthesis protein HicB [Clostridia bacterium]|nr:pilus biosynthesis protein HicB [Clostridia bacterium]